MHFFTRFSILFILTVSYSISVYSQGGVLSPSEESSSHDYTLNSANSEATRVTNIDMFHGTLSIHIPICTLNSWQLSIPISLNYSTPRRDTEEVFHPGWLGLGWQLSAGGAISSTSWQGDDNQTRVYQFNFCGHSGSFFILPSDTIIVDSSTDFAFVERTYSVWGKATGFTMRTTDGITYHFDSSVGEESSIYLRSIEHPCGDEIYFGYAKENTGQCVVSDNKYKTRLNANYLINGQSVKQYEKIQETDIYDIKNFQPVYLQTISGNGNVQVEFVRSQSIEKNYPPHFRNNSDSLDYFSRYYAWWKLDAIRLRDMENNRIFKEFRMEYTSSADSVLELKSIREVGFNQDGSEVSMPPYRFFYNDFIYTDDPYEVGSIRTLQKQVYPTGGYSCYYYDQHLEADPYLICPSARIRTIDNHPSEGYPLWRTEYNYSPGAISRVKCMSKKVAFNGILSKDIVEWSKSTGYDQFAGFPAFPTADIIGYHWVGVTQSRVEEVLGMVDKIIGEDTIKVEAMLEVPQKSEYKWYNFTNYDYEQSNIDYKMNRHGQRGAYKKVGLLTSVNTEHESIEYEYYDQEPRKGKIYDKNGNEITNINGFFLHEPDGKVYNSDGEEITDIDELMPRQDIDFSISENMPFMDSSNNMYNKEYKWEYYYAYRTNKLKSITHYPVGSINYKDNLIEPTKITRFSYNFNTNKVSCKQTILVQEGDTFKTEYHYPYSPYLKFKNYPAYEIVHKKNGKVIAAEATKFHVLNQDYDYFMPKIKYIHSDTSYKPSSYNPVSETLTLQKTWDQLVSYEYDRRGFVTKEIPTGSEPTLYERDDYGRVTKITTGQMVTRYTYNVHGVTSVTLPNGQVETIEYDALGRPVLRRDTQGNILEKIDYEFNLQP